MCQVDNNHLKTFLVIPDSADASLTPRCPRLSFVMPAWKAEWLGEAIESILNQTYQDIELIVVDDCSPEDLQAVVARYDDPRISYHRNKQNLGGIHLTHQWMHCINLAHGAYVVIASDDDVYAPTFAEACMKLADDYPMVDIIRGGVQDVDETGQVLWQEDLSRLSGAFISQIEYTWAYREGIVSICMGNLVFKRSALFAKGFREFPRALGSDIAVAIELAEHGMALADAGLFSFRHSSVHLSGSVSQLSPKMDALNLFFDWLMNYQYTQPQTSRDEFLLADLANEGWRQKCVRDYWNDVIRLIPPKELPSYLFRTQHASLWEKGIMLLRYIKYKL